jgi:hypothetical protein
MPESLNRPGGRRPRLYVWPDDKITAYSDPAYGYLYEPSAEDPNVWVPVRELTPEELAMEEARVARAEAEEARQRKAAAARRVRAARKSMQPEDSYTYLVGTEGSPIVKIGWALNPNKRLATLQIGSPMRLAILWTQWGAYEDHLHAEFDAFRVHGEWFDFAKLGDPVEAVTAAVERLKSAEQ